MSNDTPDKDTTKSTKTRWKYTTTLLSVTIVLSLPILLAAAGLGLISLNAIGSGWFGLYFLVTAMAATWAFGKETLEAVRETRNK